MSIDNIKSKNCYMAGKTESPVRLTGTSVPFEGRLEIFHLNQWGTVCSDGFNKQAAQVVCSMLGYPR